MSNFNFKVGDKVYCPKASNKILTLADEGNSRYPVMIALKNGAGHSFTIDGKYHTYDLNPTIFPATGEWYDKLVQVYPDLEPPPKRKDPREIIQAMFESGKWYLVNYRICTNTQQILSNKPKNKVITKQQFNLMNYDEYFNRYAYCNIEVICPNTGKAIIDFVNGEVVLED